ncbi:MAG TPA: lamin tail domain-containing protein [Paludibacter sp.]|nr:lamin tail domain-containing protein [Paludibacter sp.]
MLDKQPPVWTTLSIEQPNKLKLTFSEAMDFSHAAFSVDHGMESPASQTISDDKASIELTFGSNFTRGNFYKLTTSGLKDLAGNMLIKTDSIIGIIEAKAIGDLILNEVMFENPANSLEYVEIYNKSDKLLDVSNLVFTTRKTDGTLNTGTKIPAYTLMPAHGYLAICAKADSVQNYHHCPTGSNILSTSSWYSLNNTSSTLVLTSSAKDTIYDELTYNTNWHNSWVKDPKGISLERTGPDLSTQSQFSWHSSVSTATNYGTPGFKNSEYVDKEAPVWTSFTLEQPNKLKLTFSEAMDYSKATFNVDQELGSPVSQSISYDKRSIILDFSSDFAKGKLYKLQISGMTDLAGNALIETSRTIGIVEPKSVGDLILNEVMFENPANSLEYVEVYNKSDKLLDVSGLTFTTRKTDGTLNTATKIPLKTLMLPHSYLALCANADSVRNYHTCPADSTILTTSWSPLNNESSTLVLASAAKDTIYDELIYNVKWHNSWIKDPKGISLERTSPDLPTNNQASWHSCLSSATNYGTPGFKNSEYVDKEAPVWISFTLEQPNKMKLVFSEAMDYSKATFSIDDKQGSPVLQTISDDKTTIELTFNPAFAKGKLFILKTNGLADLVGNTLIETSRTIGIVEPKSVGDLILNEVMFENPLSSLEYVEVYNKSDKLLDVSGLVFTTRKTDGSLNIGCKVPQKTWMLPHAYLALCANADSVRNYHTCPTESNILSTSSWSPFNNESSTLALTNAAKDTIYDELAYNTKWHNSWVKDPKGISLERTGPDLSTKNQASWHSCLSISTNYGTPGFENSFYEDKEAPAWASLIIEQPNKLKLTFSEAMDYAKATFIVDQGIGSLSAQTVSDDKTTIELTFASNFERGKLYKLQLSGLTDLAGNTLIETSRTIGIVEPKSVGDLILNEVMFENPVNSLEYVEIYNKSDKLLDVSNLVFTTRKTDGTLNTGTKIPAYTLMPAHGYLAICAKADSVQNCHHCPTGSNILSTSSWSPLNNESSTLVLASAAKDTIYDELAYNVKWHNSWVKDPKGISLERTNPDLPTQSQFSWHSSVSTATNYGTPGFKNSEYIDKEVPTWTSFSLEQPNKLKLVFSEAMDYSKAIFNVDQELGSPVSQSISDDTRSIILDFASDFEKGKMYTLQISGLSDLAGNTLIETSRTIGIVEPKSVGDLILNEVMFENPLSSLEYVEVYNKSDKLLDVSGLTFTTRKTDGTLNTGTKIPLKTWMLPHAYLALCANADSVRNYHTCPAESNILSTSSWSPLNNESSTLVLASAAKDTIYDELTYNVKWHNSLVKNTKGVALERINPLLPTQNPESWHSAASEVNYGTPGYKNSQYRDISDNETTKKTVWTEPEAFSPDNDGVDDVCFIRYKTETPGYVANAAILNQVGVKVFQLASNILLGTEGFLSWDGRTDKGKNANVGIYILYFEMFNTQTGARKKMKLPIVVSTR